MPSPRALTESFFDFRARINKRTTQPEPTEAKLERAISVADLTARIDGAIKAGVPGAVLVRGEISNLNIHRSSGHIYFTLKDPTSCIDCVMFRSDAARLQSPPIDGMEALITGGVRVFAQRGRYQLYCTNIAALGRGALEIRFQQLKDKLEREGLFDPDRKRALPLYPQRIALISSREAAGLADMLKVFKRTPWIDVKLVHVPVQGTGASVHITRAIQDMTRTIADVVIVARGGGSLEDLWEFNEEIVARAIVACAIPVMTGIGHEVDVSIADLVADYHAHTPTEAAQVAIAHWKQADDLIDTAAIRLRRSLQSQLQDARQRLTTIERHEVFRRPKDRIERFRQLLDDNERRLRAALDRSSANAQRAISRLEHRLHAQHPRTRIVTERQRLQRLSMTLTHRADMRLVRIHGQLDAFDRQLHALSPTNVLSRGYSMTTLKNGQLVKSAKDVKRGDVLVTQLADGTVESVAKDPNQPELF